MARGGPSKQLRRQQSKDHNEKQAQARRERKAGAEAGPSSIHDVFEYVTNQQDGSKAKKDRDGRMTKRAQRNDAGDQDVREGKRVGGGESDDGEEEEADRFEQTGPSWDNGDGVVRSEDDEEIDSDEAFDESDEEKYEGWKFGRGERPAGGDAEESDDDDDDDMVDLSKMLDGGDSEGESEGGSDDEDDDEDDDDELQRRMESIGAASGTKRAAEDSEEGTSKGAKRRVLMERTEAVDEGEWSAPNRRAQSSLLTIDNLMDPVRAQGGTAFTSLRDTAKALKAKQKSQGKEAVASKKGGGALQAPLPSIVQDRLNRSAAYDETKAEVQGWQQTIKRIREAEHLSFPLQPDPVIKPSTLLMTSQFKPSNDFERGVADLLEKEGLSEKRLEEAEELKMNERGMSADEIRARREELRKMRDLIFREEQKAKRVSKIKSKTYRKIARKQRERDNEKAREAGLLLGDAKEEEEEDREKAERLRAKERATLKHKNTGKWAKNLIGLHGSNDMPEARNAIEEQLQRGEELRRRIHGREEEENEGDDESDASEGSGGEGANGEAFDELRALERKSEDQRRRDEEEMEGKKGVWGMKFMKQAREKKARGTQDEIDNFEREMREMERPDGPGGSDDNDDEVERQLGQARPNPGRMVFSSSAAAPVPADGGNKDDDDDEEAVGGFAAIRPTARPVETASGAEAGNPWLTGKGATKLSRRKNESTVSKEGTQMSKAANKIQKHIAKGEDERREAVEDAQVDIDPEARLKLRGASSQPPKQASKAKVAAQGDDGDDGNDDSLDDEPEEVRGRGAKAIRQRDLVAEAFAGDDVAAEFADEKAAAVEGDAPQTIDTSLPGWGSWGGKGVRVNKKKAEEQRKRFSKVVAGLDPSKRKDAGLTNVIINQKKDTKADRYRGKDVPYPYTSRAQYEMAMRNPLGPEWNTRTQHQKLTLPRVTTKPGKAIKPIERMF